ncbi:MAG: phosphoribosylformylglycinamidine cyclo-ligase [Firmicutes bacterium]|nr:phosphoribosylformylglycinamidine cyclo-ligase [Bacillota bacterium]
MAEEYAKAGVSVEAGYESVRLMKEHVRKTFNENVVTDLGGFGGLYSLASASMEEPILVSGTDGVGTKLKVAFLLDKHDTIGIDAVAMCVNDIICCGATPLFFLDYIACGKNIPTKIASIVKGVADGCVQGHSALIGGETAEHPGMMPDDEYDIAGFSVGIVDKKNIIDGKTIREGDALIGIASSGIHSNGYSLVRRVFGLNEPDAAERVREFYPELGMTLGEALLTPTRIYVNAIEALKKAVTPKAICHITGGGFYENIPRMLPAHFDAGIALGSWPVPPIFELLRDRGEISEHGMFNTFNMGIGMIVAVSASEADAAVEALEQAGEQAYIIGEVIKADHEVPEVIIL